MNGLTRVLVVSIVAIAVTDSVAFYRIQQHPGEISIPFVLLVIGITVLPIAIRYVIETRHGE